MPANSNSVAIRKFKNGFVPFQGVASCFVFLEECLGDEESNIQVWEIVAFTLKHVDAALIVDNLVSNGYFLFGEQLAGYSLHDQGDGDIFQGDGDEIVQTGADNLRASGVNDQFEVIIPKEKIALRCL